MKKYLWRIFLSKFANQVTILERNYDPKSNILILIVQPDTSYEYTFDYEESIDYLPGMYSYTYRLRWIEFNNIGKNIRNSEYSDNKYFIEIENITVYFSLNETKIQYGDSVLDNSDVYQKLKFI